MFDVAEHLAGAILLSTLRPEVGLSVRQTFFYGSERESPHEGEPPKTTPLPVPGFAKYGQVLVSSVVRLQGQEQLLRYCSEVFRLARRHRKGANATGHYFWMRPELCSPRGTVGFAWYDTYPETAQLLEALQAPGDNRELLHGIEQGWQVSIRAIANAVYIGVGTDEADVPDVVYRTNRTRLAAQAAVALAQTRQVLGHLVQETGHNPWLYQA